MLKATYPDCEITVITSNITKKIIDSNNHVTHTLLYNKFFSFRDKLSFIKKLVFKYDILVDFKNSILQFIICAKKNTSFVRFYHSGIHEKDRNIALLGKIIKKNIPVTTADFRLSADEIAEIDLDKKKFIGVACSSKSDAKTFDRVILAKVFKDILEHGEEILVFGLSEDREYYGELLSYPGVTDMVGKTNLAQLSYLIKNNVKCLLSVDSGILHIASYFNVPIVALFGPTDPLRYGPWSDISSVLQTDTPFLADIEPIEIRQRIFSKGFAYA